MCECVEKWSKTLLPALVLPDPFADAAAYSASLAFSALCIALNKICWRWPHPPKTESKCHTGRKSIDRLVNKYLGKFATIYV